MNYGYTCGHWTQFRLSTCSGTFLYRADRSKYQRVVRCCTEAEMMIQSKQQCGLCQRKLAQQEFEIADKCKAQDNAIFDMDADPWADTEDELNDRAVKKAKQEMNLRNAFPDGISKLFPVPDWLGAEYRAALRDSEGERARSPLQNMFKPEDVEDDDD